MDIGHVLISLDKNTEALLRRLAKERYAGKKGSISAVVGEALTALENDIQHQRAVDRMLANMREGLPLKLKNGKAYEKREDIYAERLRKQGLR